MPVLRTLCVAGVLGALLVAVGCRAPAPDGPAECVIAVVDRHAYLDDAISLLRRHDFPPARLDRAGGLIVSRPTTSGQWFEIWRGDVRGGYQALESNLHTMRRTVRVTLEPVESAGATQLAVTTAPAEGRYRLRVEVEKERLSVPQRQVTTTSGALALYSDEVPTAEGAVGPKSRMEDWVVLGRDPLLEAELLAKLAALPEARRVE